MARTGITPLAVFEAANHVMATGKTPTVELVRIALGGTGSNSTITKYLREWKASQSGTQLLASQEHIPPELVGVVKTLWEQLMAQAQAELLPLQTTLEKEREALQQTAQRLQQDNVRLQQSEQQLKEAQTHLAQELKTAHAMVHQLNITLSTAKTDLSHAEQQIADKQTHCDELYTQLKNNQANLDHYREESLEQRQRDKREADERQQHLETTLRQLENKVESLKQQALDSQLAYEQVVFERKTLDAQLVNMTTHVETTQSQLTEAKQSLSAEREARRLLQTQVETLQQQGDAQHHTTRELETHHALLTEQLTVAQKIVADLTDQTKTLAQEKWDLGQEAARLEGQLQSVQRWGS